tara:strand:- start:370 stop:975 length:606 start_codon:yes stop_codon:yes gene_type:complete
MKINLLLFTISVIAMSLLSCNKSSEKATEKMPTKDEFLASSKKNSQSKAGMFIKEPEIKNTINSNEKIIDANKEKLPNLTTQLAEEATIDTPELLSEGGPKIQFENTVWDFGKIQQGESVNHIFKFINIGNEPLIISDAKAACGCTVPERPTEPILPGEEGEIKVQFNSAGKDGRQNKTVTITTNCEPNTTKLRVVGTILK